MGDTHYDCNEWTGLKKYVCQGKVPDPSGGFRRLHPNEQARYMALFNGDPIPPNRLAPRHYRSRKQGKKAKRGEEPTYYELVGVGSELHRLLKQFGIKEIPGCSCKDKAKKMDQRGLLWCENNKDSIVKWLSDNAKERLVQVSRTANLIPTTLKTGLIKASALAILNLAIGNTKRAIRERVKTKLPITVAVTTAPRGGESLLPRCVESILNSGFENLTVYAEPESNLNLELSSRIDIVRRPKRLGAWHNWMQTLEDCLSQSADTILIVQDDCVFSKGVYDYLKASLWPDYNCSALQLCCSTFYRNMIPGFNLMPYVGMVGAWATVMHRYYAERILNYGRIHGWRGNHKKVETNPVNMKAIDDYIGHASREIGARCYINYPSIVLHDADISSLNHGNSKGSRNNRATKSWIGMNSIALDHVPLWKERVQFQD